MRNIVVGTLASLLLTAGCVSLSDSQARSEVEGQEGDSDDCKIEGEQIGREGAALQLGSTTVKFHDWVAKPGEPGEYLGFSITVTGAPYDHYIVKAGGKKYIADGDGWTHPSGMTSNASAISNIDFCECEPPQGGGEDDDGGGGGGGDGTIL